MNLVVCTCCYDFQKCSILSVRFNFYLLKEKVCDISVIHILMCFLFFLTGNFSAMLKFVVKDCDPITGQPDLDEGYNDEYMVRTHINY